MTIYFPENPENDLQYPKDGDIDGLKDTGGIIYVFNSRSNSWNIVGPDNVATTDWVLNQKKDDTTALDKGYDIIASTNDITLTVELQSNNNINKVANDILDQSMRGHVVDDQLPYNEGLEIYLPGWEDGQVTDGFPGGGAFCIAGIDKDQLVTDKNNDKNCFRTEYKYTVDLLFSEQDSTSTQIDWLSNTGVGDTIEVNFLGSVGNADYVIYRVTSNRQVNENYVALRVEFMGSSNPDQSWRGTSGDFTSYQFKVFKKAFTADGGEVEGKFAIYYTAKDTFIVGKNRDEAPVLVVNTTENMVLANDLFTTDLNTSKGFIDDNAFITLGHLNYRMGSNDPSKQGPYMPTRGGVFSGGEELVFKRYGGATNGNQGGFRIKGQVGTLEADILSIKFDDQEGDSILYKGASTNDPEEILNRSQINDALDANLDGYLPINGSVMMTGFLQLYQKDPLEPNHAASKKYVDARPLVIPNIESNDPVPDEPGSLYSSNGFLYWVKP